MKFWILNLIIGIVLVGLAVVFFTNQELFITEAPLTIEEQQTQEVETSQQELDRKLQEKIEKGAEELLPKGEGKNKAADGLSNFYAQLNPDLGTSGPKIRNNVVYLPDPSGDLVKTLEARRMVTRPLRKTWQSARVARPFRLGETILQKLTEYAKEEGLSIIWWLNRDFLVKSPFRVKKTISRTAFQLAKSVEGHFQNGVNVFFCYQQRTIVVIDEPISYLVDECLLVEK